MADPDRLLQLRQQRALVAQHLAWLDGEISRVNGAAANPSRDSPPQERPGSLDLTARPINQSALSNRSVAAPEAEMDKVFIELAEEDSTRSSISKSGCWIIFAGVILFGLAGLVGFILFRYR